MHYFKRNIGDYHRKAGRLSMLEHGAYTLLMDACYDREKFPTKEQAIDWCFARTEEEVKAVEYVLTKFFTVNEDGEYIQDRILAELLKYQENSEKNKQIALDREEKRRLKRKGACHEASTDRAPAVHGIAPNHKPLTNNHKPKEKTARFAAPSLVEVSEYCKERGNSVDPQAFIDHYEANGWVRGKTKIKDWKACVRTWEKNQKPTDNNEQWYL